MVRNFSVVEPSVKQWDSDPIVNLFSIIVTLFVVVGNGILLLFIFKSKVKLLKPNLFIASLTLCDFLIGLLEAPLIIYVSFNDVSQYFCEFYLNFGQGLARISSSTIMIISIDRYVKLRYPIVYKSKFRGTRKRIAIIAFLWLSSYFLSAIRLADSILNSGNYIKGCFTRESMTLLEQIENLITIVGSNIVALIFYIRIMGLIRSVKTLKNRVLMIKPQPLNDPTVKPIRIHQGHYAPEQQVVSDQAWKYTTILGLIVVFNLVFVCLPPILYTIYLMCHSCQNESLFHVIPSVFMCSSAVNPIVFALTNKDFKSFITSKIFRNSH